MPLKEAKDALCPHHCNAQAESIEVGPNRGALEALLDSIIRDIQHIRGALCRETSQEVHVGGCCGSRTLLPGFLNPCCHCLVGAEIQSVGGRTEEADRADSAVETSEALRGDCRRSHRAHCSERVGGERAAARCLQLSAQGVHRVGDDVIDDATHRTSKRNIR
eukprot:scaffold127197_cov37-Tisochrysis_lutea.AAC.1